MVARASSREASNINGVNSYSTRLQYSFNDRPTCTFLSYCQAMTMIKASLDFTQAAIRGEHVIIGLGSRRTMFCTAMFVCLFHLMSLRAGPYVDTNDRHSRPATCLKYPRIAQGLRLWAGVAVLGPATLLPFTLLRPLPSFALHPSWHPSPDPSPSLSGPVGCMSIRLPCLHGPYAGGPGIHESR